MFSFDGDMKKSFSQRAASSLWNSLCGLFASTSNGLESENRLASCFGMRSCTAAWAALIIIFENVSSNASGIYPRHSLYMRIARSKCFWQ